MQTQPRLIAVEVKAAGSTPAYEEIVTHLEPLIERQTELLKETVRKKGPEATALVYGIDITGMEISVCLACGVVGHDFRPSMMRVENPSINTMTESLVVFMEAASRAGVRYGVFAYDDGGRLILRSPSESNSVSHRAAAIASFEKFRDRFAGVTLKSGFVSGGRVNDNAWLQSQGSRWQPSDASRRVAGRANDELAKSTFIELFGSVPQCDSRSGLLMKSLPPSANLRGMEAALKSHAINIAGLAVGAQATNVSRNFFEKTTIARSMGEVHAVQSEAIGRAMRSTS